MKIKKGFTLRSVMGQNIVLAEGANADSFGKIIALNESATYLWEQLIKKSFTEEDAASLLVERYGIPREQALADATRILTLMTEKGLLER